MRKLKILKMARKVSWDRQLYIILAGYNTGTVLKTRDEVLFFVRKKRFIVVTDKLRTCDTSKTELFAKIVYSLKPLTILTRSYIFRSVTGCWILLVYFINFSSGHLFYSLVCIHVERGLHLPFNISSFTHAIKLKFVAVMTFMK